MGESDRPFFLIVLVMLAGCADRPRPARTRSGPRTMLEVLPGSKELVHAFGSARKVSYDSKGMDYFRMIHSGWIHYLRPALLQSIRPYLEWSDETMEEPLVLLEWGYEGDLSLLFFLAGEDGGRFVYGRTGSDLYTVIGLDSTSFRDSGKMITDIYVPVDGLVTGEEITRIRELSANASECRGELRPEEVDGPLYCFTFWKHGRSHSIYVSPLVFEYMATEEFQPSENTKPIIELAKHVMDLFVREFPKIHPDLIVPSPPHRLPYDDYWRSRSGNMIFPAGAAIPGLDDQASP